METVKYTLLFLLFIIIINALILLVAFIAYKRNGNKGSEIEGPKQTFKIHQLPNGSIFIVLDASKEKKILQFVEDYKSGMRTNVFKNTFYLDDPDQDNLERLKTYQVINLDDEGSWALKQVSLFITPDYIAG